MHHIASHCLQHMQERFEWMVRRLATPAAPVLRRSAPCLQAAIAAPAGGSLWKPEGGEDRCDESLDARMLDGDRRHGRAITWCPPIRKIRKIRRRLRGRTSPSSAR